MARKRSGSARAEPTIRSGLLLLDPKQRTGEFQGVDRREVYRDGKVFVVGEDGEVGEGVEVAFGEWVRSVGG